MKESDFYDASIYLTFLEKGFLSGSSIERLVDTNGVEEVIRLISQNSRIDFSQLKAPEDYDVILTEELERAYELIRGYAGEKNAAVADIPALKYVANNLKAAIKSLVLGSGTPRYSKIPTLDMETAERFAALLLEEGDVPDTEERQLAKQNARGKLPSWVAGALEAAISAYRKSRDPQDIDLQMDKALFAETLRASLFTRSAFIVEYARKSIDYYNVKTLLRAREMNKGAYFLRLCLVEGGDVPLERLEGLFDSSNEAIASRLFYTHFGSLVTRGLEAYARSQNWSELERLLDSSLIEFLISSKMIAFGPESLFSYLYFKENEVRQVRILLAGKLNNLSADKLRERLRVNYA